MLPGMVEKNGGPGRGTSFVVHEATLKIDNYRFWQCWMTIFNKSHDSGSHFIVRLSSIRLELLHLSFDQIFQ